MTDQLLFELLLDIEFLTVTVRSFNLDDTHPRSHGVHGLANKTISE